MLHFELNLKDLFFGMFQFGGLRAALFYKVWAKFSVLVFIILIFLLPEDICLSCAEG